MILGISSAAKFSHNNKILNTKDYKLISEHIKKININLRLKNYFKKNNIKKITKIMLNDKKNSDEKINLILLKKIGTTSFKNKFNLKRIENFFLNHFNTI